MTYWKVMWGDIREVIIDRVTDKYIVSAGGFRKAKKSSFVTYVPTKAEAKALAISNLQKSLEKSDSEERTEYLNKVIQYVEAL